MPEQQNCCISTKYVCLIKCTSLIQLVYKIRICWHFSANFLNALRRYLCHKKAKYFHVFTFQYAKEVEDYENRHGGIVLDPSKEESFGLYFSTLQPHTISPAYLDIYHKKALLIVRMLELRLGTTLLLQVSHYQNSPMHYTEIFFWL